MRDTNDLLNWAGAALASYKSAQSKYLPEALLMLQNEATLAVLTATIHEFGNLREAVKRKL
jgi:hypothetical protein